MASRVRFEVFGKVQGVFFRKHTKMVADSYSLTGWCQNTPDGTVIGEAQGAKDKVEEFINWLSTTGSPKCTIEKLEHSMVPCVEGASEFIIDRSKNGRRF
jgi:acylphosphatase